MRFFAYNSGMPNIFSKNEEVRYWLKEKYVEKY